MKIAQRVPVFFKNTKHNLNVRKNQSDNLFVNERLLTKYESNWRKWNTKEKPNI